MRQMFYSPLNGAYLYHGAYNVASLWKVAKFAPFAHVAIALHKKGMAQLND